MEKNRFVFSASLPFVSVTSSTIPGWNLSSTSMKSIGAILFHISDPGNNYELEYEFPNMDFADLWHSQQIRSIDGLLYGMIHTGGNNLLGYLFQYNPVNSTFTKKIDFDITR